MKVYSLSDKTISAFRKRMIRLSIMIYPIVILIFIIVLVATSDIKFDSLMITIALIGGIIVAVTLYFANIRTIRRYNEIWESIRIEMGKDYIIRSQVHIPEVRIDRDEITAIEESKGGLFIRTSDKRRTLIIPVGLEDAHFQEIRNKLHSWQPIQLVPTRTKVKSAALLVVIFVGFGILFASSSLWLVLVTGITLIGYFSFTYWNFRQTEGIDPQFRRNFLISALFLIFITSLKVFFLSDL